MAILYNWPKAAPLYKQAGDDFMRGGDGKGNSQLGWGGSAHRLRGRLAGAHGRTRARITESRGAWRRPIDAALSRRESRLDQ